MLRLLNVASFLGGDSLPSRFIRRFCNLNVHREGLCRNLLFLYVGADTYNTPLVGMKVLNKLFYKKEKLSDQQISSYLYGKFRIFCLSSTTTLLQGPQVQKNNIINLTRYNNAYNVVDFLSEVHTVAQFAQNYNAGTCTLK